MRRIAETESCFDVNLPPAFIHPRNQRASMERPFRAYKGEEPYVFVSYAHADAAVVYPELVRLKEEGFNIWYDEGIAPGQTWRDEVALALTQCKVFLYFVTPRSIASSNCLKELNFSLSRERKILSVHLERTELTAGLELGLSDRQAILRADHSESAYHQKLADALRSLLPDTARQPTVLEQQPATTNDKSIAILPLVNRSNDPDNEYLCDGISEELISGLASLKGLRVASQISSFTFKNQNADLALMGSRLRVDHILSGSIQKSGNRVRITFLLSRVGDGTSLWSKRYDRELRDIFELQEDVAHEVINALKIELVRSSDEPLLDIGTENARAYEIFLLGLHAARDGTREKLEAAVAHFTEAIELDPDYARAYWWLYFCYWRLIGVGLPRAEMQRKGEAALEKARAAGFVPPVPWIKARRDLIPASRPNQRTLALEAAQKIRAPDPEWRLFEYIQFGECLIAAGFNHGACDYYEYYLSRTNHDLSGTWIQPRYRSLLSQLGRFDKAIELMTRVGVGGRAIVYSRTGQYELAEQVLATVNTGPFYFDQFYLYFWRRELDKAKEYYRNADPAELEPLDHYWVLFLLGDFESGMDHLEEDVARGAHPAVYRSNIGEILTRSMLATLEAHPRYQALLKRFEIDAAWCDELLKIANDLSRVTGIRVQPDDDY